MSSVIGPVSGARAAGVLPVVVSFTALALAASFAAPGPREHPHIATGTSVAGGTVTGGVETSGSGGASSPGGTASTSPGGVTGGGGGVAAATGAGGTGAAAGGGGPTCAPGQKQFSWSVYAPVCAAGATGGNGGGTGPGVTGTTITMTYRQPNTTEQSIINAAVGSAIVDANAYLSDLQTYAKYFDTQYQLYGRKVVIASFQGQGDYVQEDYGGETSGAQADAATAQGMGAFADVTFPLYSSQAYWQYLAAEHVIGFGGVGLPTQWFQQYAPFEYSVYGPTGTAFGDAIGNTACRRMNNMPAIFAGEADFTHENRKFGLITPDNPVYMEDGDTVQHVLSGCGASLTQRVNYTINVAEYGTEATSIVAKMKASGVTTVLCICDPIMPILLSQEADQQSYHPEWFGPSWADPDSRNFAADQQAHTMALGTQMPAPTGDESYRVFLQASGGKQPAEQYYYVAYYELLPIFGALQDAGPGLNPSSFEQGWFAEPTVFPGTVLGGGWRFGTGAFDPDIGEHFVWWNPSATSLGDGKQGAYQWCDGGRQVVADDASTFGPPGTQLACFGH